MSSCRSPLARRSRTSRSLGVSEARLRLRAAGPLRRIARPYPVWTNLWITFHRHCGDEGANAVLALCRRIVAETVASPNALW
jgi:hypothetical protein